MNSVSFNNLFGTFRNYFYEPLIQSYLCNTNDEKLMNKQGQTVHDGAKVQIKDNAYQ